MDSISNYFNQVDSIIATSLQITSNYLEVGITIRDQSGFYLNRRGFVIQKQLGISLLRGAQIHLFLNAEDYQTSKVRLCLISSSDEILTVQFVELNIYSIRNAIIELIESHIGLRS